MTGTEILLIDPDDVVGELVADRLARMLDCTVHWARDEAEADRLVGRTWRRLALAVSAWRMPNGGTAEPLIRRLAGHKVPTILYVSTGDDVRDYAVTGLHVVDIIPREGPPSLEYLLRTARRLVTNRQHLALVVDPSDAARRLMVSLLRRFQFQVLEAESGEAALKLAQLQPLSLVVTEARLPGLSGLTLVRALRKLAPPEELAVLCCTEGGKYDVLPKFLKAGATDIFEKPYAPEELWCRATAAIELNEKIRDIRIAAVTDYLSGLYNRRHLYEEGRKFRDRAITGGIQPVVAMVDIDFFKKVNDTYGHDAGDVAIKGVSRVIRETVAQSGLAARFGGEEFCVVMAENDNRVIRDFFEHLRTEVQSQSFEHAGRRFSVTSSIGVCIGQRQGLDTEISQADAALYEAKQTGRNRVVTAAS